jgi:hypothetical protein
MPAAQALCWHAAAREIDDQPLPGANFIERDILVSLARSKTAQHPHKKHRPAHQAKGAPE